MKSDDGKTGDDALLETARLRMDAAQTAEMPHNERAVGDLRFLVGDQWPEEERVAREAEGRPCLTINALPQYLRQVTGQVRNLNPAVRVSPADGKATKDVAEIIEGMVRHIEYACDASSVYEAAAESAAACGAGYWRLRTDYCEGDTFDQEILIERIHNPFSVFFDPMAKDPTRKDAGYCFIVEEMDKDDFEERYPEATVADITTDHRPAEFVQWRTNDTVVVAEYYWIEYDEYKIGITSDGQIVNNPPRSVRSRTVRKPKVKWAKITGDSVLEGPLDIPGRFIPVVAVTGEEFHLGEETYRSSVIRFAKDPQMLYNYSRSAAAETVSLQPKAPYLVTAKQVAGLETFWNEANHANRPYLPYNVDPAAPAPQRTTPPVSSPGLMTEIQIAAEDMKRTTGIYDAGLGAKSNETSGVAIDARKQESQNATSVYADNMVKGVVQTGHILVEWIPVIYDTRRVVRVLGEDDQEKMVVINDIMMSEQGVMPVNDVKIGKYGVKVSVGPSYSTKRQESQDGMMQFLKVVPQAAAVTADLVAGAQEWPDADRFAERIRKTLPPGIAEEDQDEPTPEQQAQKQQAMQAQQAQMQAQQAAEQIALREAEAKARKAEADAVAAEADAIKAQAEAQKAQMEMANMTGQLQTEVAQREEQAFLHGRNSMNPQPIL